MRSIQVGFGILYFVGNLFLVLLYFYFLIILPGEGYPDEPQDTYEIYILVKYMLASMIFLNLFVWSVTQSLFRQYVLINTIIIGFFLLISPNIYIADIYLYEPLKLSTHFLFQSFIILSLLQYLFLSRRARNKIQRHTSLIQGEVGDHN